MKWYLLFFSSKGWTRSKSLSKFVYKSFGEFLYPLKHLRSLNKIPKRSQGLSKKKTCFPKKTFRQDFLSMHFLSPPKKKTSASTDKPCPSMASRNRTARKRERVWSNLRWWILAFQHVRYALFTDGLKKMKWEYGYNDDIWICTVCKYMKNCNMEKSYDILSRLQHWTFTFKKQSQMFCG